MVRDGLIVKLLSIPKSFYVSWRLAGFKKAFSLPVWVRYNTVLNALGGVVRFGNDSATFASLSIGFASSGISDKKNSRSLLEINKGGVVTVSGKVTFGHGTKLIVGPKGRLNIEDGVSATAEGTIICYNKISIGAHSALAWYSMIMDTDFHSVEDTLSGEINAASAKIIIGERCWIGTRSIVLKGTVIPDGCILGANSTACSQFHEENTLLAGSPAVEKKHNITKSTKGDFQTL